MKRRISLYILLLTIFLHLFLASPNTFGAILKGRVLEKGTEDPLKWVVVGLTRKSFLGKGLKGNPIPVEMKAVTNKTGSFRFRISSSQEGSNEWILFTSSKNHRNRIYPNKPFLGFVPSYEDVLLGGYKILDLSKRGKSVTLFLSPAIREKKTFFVKMPDGVVLATDVHFPVGSGPWPVILYRTPYNKDLIPSMVQVVQGQVLRGYTVIVQDFRGRYSSKGKYMSFTDCGWGTIRDGHHTIEWILKQKWCNGNIGAEGAPVGVTQILLAGSDPPGLKCQVERVAPASFYHHGSYPGGAFRKALTEGWVYAHSIDSENIPLMKNHHTYDEFWKSLDSIARCKEIKVPCLHIGGWYDVFSQGTIDAFKSRQEQGGPGARGNQKLVMGPWSRRGFKSLKIGEITLPENAIEMPSTGSSRAWYDYWLRGMETGIMEEPAVAYYTMGAWDEPGAPGKEWRTSPAWPPPCRETPLFCRKDGTLSWDPPGENEGSRSFQYDPANPVPTRGGCNLFLDSGPFDQRPVEKRPDVLLFTTRPLEKPLEVTGRIRAKLWISSNQPDTDFTAKLTDVYPDGRSILLCDGILRVRYRESFEKSVLMEPGKVYAIELDLWSTSNVFNKNHCLRLAISSSNSPRFEPNPIKAKNTLHHSARYPSHLLLPVPK